MGLVSLTPHENKPYNRYGWMSDLFMWNKLFKGTKCLDLEIIPIEILFFGGYMKNMVFPG